MKWVWLPAVFAALAWLPATVSAQEVLPIGNLPQIDDRAPTTWAISGFEIINVRQSDGNQTPIMRSQVWDARLVEILSRTQAPPLRGSDIRAMTRGGHDYIVVRRYLLAEVKPQDAKAAGTSKATLARQWAASARRVLPQIAPAPSRFGI
jgi:hypothetical protein